MNGKIGFSRDGAGRQECLQIGFLSRRIAWDYLFSVKVRSEFSAGYEIRGQAPFFFWIDIWFVQVECECDRPGTKIVVLDSRRWRTCWAYCTNWTARNGDHYIVQISEWTLGEGCVDPDDRCASGERERERVQSITICHTWMTDMRIHSALTRAIRLEMDYRWIIFVPLE